MATPNLSLLCFNYVFNELPKESIKEKKDVNEEFENLKQKKLFFYLKQKNKIYLTATMKKTDKNIYLLEDIFNEKYEIKNTPSSLSNTHFIKFLENFSQEKEYYSSIINYIENSIINIGFNLSQNLKKERKEEESEYNLVKIITSNPSPFIQRDFRIIDQKNEIYTLLNIYL